MDILVRIKRLVVSRRVLFTEKAEIEMARDALTPETGIRSDPERTGNIQGVAFAQSEDEKERKLYVIKGLTFDGLAVYTKGKILKKEGIDVFYVLISSKKSTDI